MSDSNSVELWRTEAEFCRKAWRTAQTRVDELEAENALLKRALAMLTRSLEDAEAESAR